MKKFKPAALEQYEWSGLQSVERYLGLTFFVIICLLIDCNNFFYKFLVWVPPEHQLLQFRIVLWGFAAIATSKEWYEYVSNQNCHRLGPFAWMTIYVSLIELSSVIKFKTNEFTEPFPLWILIGWSIIGVIFLIGLFIAY